MTTSPRELPGRQDGRTALVLGAGGDNGRSAARALAALGARVIVADADPDALEAAFGADHRFEIRRVAVGDTAAVDAIVAERAVDVLVVNPHGPSPASMSRRGTPWLDATVRVADVMAAAGRGSVILFVRTPRERAGAPAEEALQRVVSGLASDLAPYGVRVNLVAAAGAEPDSAVAFLAADASAHVTGAVLAIRPGWSALERLVPQRPVREELPNPPVPLRTHPMELVSNGRAHVRRRA